MPEPNPTLSVWAATPGRCKHLRSKEYYMGLPFHPSGSDTGGPPCWCFKTQQVFGPDGGSASRTDCGAEGGLDRACFEKDAF